MAMPVVALLRAEDQELVGNLYELRHGDNHLGRAPDNHVVLSSRWVSRHHAIVACDEGVMAIIPMKDKRVQVNGQETSGVELRCGDLIQLGLTLLRVVPPSEGF